MSDREKCAECGEPVDVEEAATCEDCGKTLHPFCFGEHECQVAESA